MANINPTNPILPSGQIGRPYSQVFNALSGNIVSTTSAPPGLSFSATGSPSITLSGTPTVTGTFNFTITANGGEDSTVYTLTIRRSSYTNLPYELTVQSPIGKYPMYISYYGMTYTLSQINITKMDNEEVTTQLVGNIVEVRPSHNNSVATYTQGYTAGMRAWATTVHPVGSRSNNGLLGGFGRNQTTIPDVLASLKVNKPVVRSIS